MASELRLRGRTSRRCVAPGEIKIASGFAGQIRGYLPQRWPAGFDPKALEFSSESFGPFAQSRRLTRDGTVVAIPTPGHTAHHISVAVVDDSATFLIAGDMSYTEAHLEAGLIDSVAEDEAVARSTLLRLRALAAKQPITFLPTHDPQTPARLAGGRTVFSTPETDEAPALA